MDHETAPVRRRGADQFVGEPELTAQFHAPRLGSEETVGSAFEKKAVSACCADNAARTEPAFEQFDLKTQAALARAADQFPGRAQAGDSSADDYGAAAAM